MTEFLQSHTASDGFQSYPVSPNFSFLYTTTVYLVSAGKLFANVKALLTHDDFPTHYAWLLNETFCEFINIILMFLYKQIFESFRSSQNVEEMVQGLLNGESDLGYNQQTGSLISLNKLTKAQIIINLYYFILLIWGHFMYYHASSSSLESDRDVHNIISIYLYFGYVFAASCVLIGIFDQSLVSMISFSPIKLPCTPTNKISINFRLKVYCPDKIESRECYICLNNYNQGDKLAELPCNSKHHFHHNCIQKWFEVKTACPLCRKTFNTSRDLSFRNERELSFVPSHSS